MKQIKQVLEFNKVFNLEINEKPTLVDAKNSLLGVKLMQEELDEYRDKGITKHDLVEVADALVDMQYILSGLIIKHGLQYCFTELFDEVHDSNMSKLENGKPIYREDGKILKGSSFFKPDLKSILEKHTNQLTID